MERPPISKRTVARVLLAAFLAPLVEVPLSMLWMVAAQAATPHMFPPFSVLRALFAGLFVGLFFALPIAWAATLLIGLPVVLAWLRLFHRISLLAIVPIATVLAVAVLFALEAGFARDSDHFLAAGSLALFALSGALISATGWWIAFGRREDGTRRDSGRIFGPLE